ncbi:MAG: Crp/Fnr family transcriptional regulator [Actinobacteria bacterium]|nr:Crp/Fnr family transcriptional regulator [Actinomycetota bacterium]
MTAPEDSVRKNRLLAALPDGTCDDWPLELVELAQGDVLFERDEPTRHVHFPVAAVVSLLVPMSDGSLIEAATVGNEGLAGLNVFLGANSLAMRAIAQIPGPALRMTTEDFRGLLADVDGPLTAVIQRYTQTLFTQLAQNVACNRLHTVEQRCARWVLMIADRVPSGAFPLTQQFLAHMLGVRRASVSEAAGRLAKDGHLAYTRGAVRILDRPGLENRSCECYGVIAAMLDRMLGDDVDPAAVGPTSHPAPLG